MREIMSTYFIIFFLRIIDSVAVSSATGTASAIDSQYVGRNLWICEIHGSRCAIYGSLARAGIHGCLRNLWILRRVRSTDLTVLISTLP